MRYRWGMLRITESFDNNNTVRVRLDGTISEASFAEVEEACARHNGNHEQIILFDMAGVMFMSNDAAKKLIQFRSDRVRIINCSPFIETLLQTIEDGRPDHVDKFKS
jgi:anti-anti-sigma regulatory factor